MTTNHPFDSPDSVKTYDKRDRLTNIAINNGGGNVSYKYNGDGLLWERTENGKTTRYYWDGDQVIAEANVSGGVATLKARYIRGQGLVAREDNQSKAYYVHNGHGDVVNLMDRTGTTKLNQYNYDIFGNIASQTENIQQPFKYSGEMQDDTTGLQYLRARWYDPSIGRFIGADSYKGQTTNPLSLNLYTYVNNNPLIYHDPSGHYTKEAVDMMLSVAAYAGKGNQIYWNIRSDLGVAVSGSLVTDRNQFLYLFNMATGTSSRISENTSGQASWAKAQLMLIVEVAEKDKQLQENMAFAFLGMVGGRSGTTKAVKPNTVVPYRPSNAPLENHHGILDVWAKNNISGYKSRKSDNPTIALTQQQHDATNQVYREWLYENTGKPVGGAVDWTKVSAREIIDLSERMFDAANVPVDARLEYYSEFIKYIS
ncbi:hypothetical protein KZ483_14355 [Paenibacillus sp. sptzw28]|uniref:RHS repeat-associated core domain-containing protein n=1 Tax=Paenibacillus sp. sptzw28 TaxID=715179 RepID=UPI001C6F1B5E|nr:RHS repeat-associated core domain-containing protein [Paenibacillus sp. sptzw28]QYR19150.1 hypothetical protein KZ483_14355 [Paenibacillus sp. sptzw28]